MNRKWFGIITLVALATSLLLSSSCARDQKLTSISIQPSGGFTFEGLNAAGQFTAYGTYIHPPQTKDITSLVTWTINVQNLATITPGGLITYTRTDLCGSGDVTATYNFDGSVYTASAPVKGALDGTASCQ